MDSRIITYAQGIFVLYGILRENGLSPSRIEAETGIRPGHLRTPDACLPLERFIRLWETAIEVTGDPALAIHLSETHEKETMHFVATMGINCSTLVQGVRMWAQYARLVCDADHVTLDESDRGLTVAYTNKSPEHQSIRIPEHYLSLLVQHARTFTRKDIVPLQVCFQHSDPGYAEDYRRFFKCPVLFEQEQNAVYLDRETADMATSYADPYLQKILRDYADQSLKQVTAADSLEEQVTALIVEGLPRGGVSIEGIARALHMSRSTLQRKLSRSGTSFKALLEETRQKLCRVYLKQDFRITQIAYLLGYSEPSTFHHAFKRWFGISPGEYQKGDPARRNPDG